MTREAHVPSNFHFPHPRSANMLVQQLMELCPVQYLFDATGRRAQRQVLKKIGNEMMKNTLFTQVCF